MILQFTTRKTIVSSIVESCMSFSLYEVLRHFTLNGVSWDFHTISTAHSRKYIPLGRYGVVICQARGLGDCLIVGVNSSETIAECKGTAPVLTDDERCEPFTV